MVMGNGWMVLGMGVFGNAFKRVRRGLPKMDFMKHKHGDCANFDNRHCKFFHFENLNPEGQACPHFKARTPAETKTK